MMCAINFLHEIHLCNVEYKAWNKTLIDNAPYGKKRKQVTLVGGTVGDTR